MYTVKQISDLAGVSVRTLHYYDEIGLLAPSEVGENGYRYYNEESLLRLQQILFFREMDLGLLQIKDIISSPTFDLVSALQSHRVILQDKINRLQSLITTVDSTIMHIVGEVEVSEQQLFAAFSEEKQKEYEKEAEELYGKENVQESVKRWNSYTKEEKERIFQEGGENYKDLITAMDKGADSPESLAVMARWHQHLRYFYEPTLEILRGLGHLYNEHPDFRATFLAMHPKLPEFLAAAVEHYCDVLELEMLEKA